MIETEQRIQDVLQSIRNILDQAAGGRARFDTDPLIRVWVLFHFIVICEACRAMPPETRRLAAGIPWRALIGLRNVIVHRYYEVNDDTVWQAVEQHLDPVERQFTELLSELSEADSG